MIKLIFSLLFIILIPAKTMADDLCAIVNGCMIGGKVIEGSCDVNKISKKVVTDGNGVKREELTNECIEEDTKIEDFKLKVSLYPPSVTSALISAGKSIFTGENAYKAENYEKWIELDTCAKKEEWGIGDGYFICVERKVDLACAYAYQDVVGSTSGALNFARSGGDFEFGFPLVLNDPLVSGNKSDIGHCRPLPAPKSTKITPRWSNLIADVCVDYNSKDRIGKNPYPMSSIVVQCVETSIRNIFSLDGSRDSFFYHIQNSFSDIVIIALTLSIILFGYKVSIYASQGQPFKSGDIIREFLKYALVIYFTIGTGMIEYYPKFSDGAKDIANSFITASSKSAVALSTGGINYCNYSEEEYDPAPGANGITYNMSHMSLWDTVDCKISTYLGIGNNDNTIIPRIINVMIVSIWSVFPPFGFIITALAFVYLSFLILLFLRIVQSYLIAVIGAAILVFISPLAITTVLFGITSSIYNGWLKQLMSFILQPIILFMFLAVFFVVIDQIVIADNEFGTKGYIKLIDPADKKKGPQSFGDEEWRDITFKCKDETALICATRYFEITHALFGIIPISFSVKDDEENSEESLATLPYSYRAFGLLVYAMLKFIVAAFVFFVVLFKIEDIAMRLTDGSFNLGRNTIFTPGNPLSTLQDAITKPREFANKFNRKKDSFNSNKEAYKEGGVRGVARNVISNKLDRYGKK